MVSRLVTLQEVFEQRARQRSISKRAKLVRQRLIERQKEEEATGLRLEAHENKLNDLRAKAGWTQIENRCSFVTLAVQKVQRCCMGFVQVAPQLTRSWEQAVGGTRSSWASDQSSMQQELCELMGLAPGSMGDCTSKVTWKTPLSYPVDPGPVHL